MRVDAFEMAVVAGILAILTMLSLLLIVRDPCLDVCKRVDKDTVIECIEACKEHSDK